jgi:hypothetical protein
MAESQLSELPRLEGELFDALDGVDQQIGQYRPTRAWRLERAPSLQSQGRASTYIMKTNDKTIATPSTTNTTNGIAPNTPFVALRESRFRPLLCEGRYPEATNFIPVCSWGDGPRISRVRRTRARRTSENAERLTLENSRRTPPRVVPRIRRSP